MSETTSTIEDLRDGPRGTTGTWGRRLFLLVLALFAIAALLNAFGQRETVSQAQGSGASLTVSSPPRVRGPPLSGPNPRKPQRALKQPTLVLDRGWFEQSTINTIEPQPSQEQTENGRVSLQFDSLSAGQELVVWVQFQANPTNLGRHRTNVVLRDGDTELATVKRSQLDLP